MNRKYASFFYLLSFCFIFFVYSFSHASCDITTINRLLDEEFAKEEIIKICVSDDDTFISWTIDPRGICRGSNGEYPRWSEYNWFLPQCEANCRQNPNCQGFAMANEQDYCQLFGSDGSEKASRFGTGTRITQGDSIYPQYTCYLKR